MSVVDDLKATRSILEERGWLQNSLTDGDGRVCVAGALNVACYGMVHRGFKHNATRGFLESQDGRRWAAYKELQKHVSGMTGQEYPYIGSIEDYNDASSTTEQDIYSLIDKTLADLGGL